jgi:hypothetical protein
MWRTCRPIND